MGFLDPVQQHVVRKRLASVASSRMRPLRLVIVRTRPGRAESAPSSPCRGFGAFFLQDGAGHKGGAGDGGAGYALLQL